jgi:nitrogen fixation protein FixH
VRDADGHPPTGLAASARLAHPADARRDRTMAMHGNGPAEFRGTTTADAGQWDLTIDLWRGEERLFRSRSRVLLR